MSQYDSNDKKTRVRFRSAALRLVAAQWIHLWERKAQSGPTAAAILG
ncbi:hypothetical protein SNOG_00014 [Parastagonospora nodorum SN15]|uniref:Uncharacterized protein n=1 Tax=Phaeosphaeria nodorum (strain SN15 / ATCC MYA-4574 / FGSC 10173) TaxID=321614 RepID=Q0V7K0_PHANO|nr:hypothetical protein SNOG_00014 [Parastagonospora nodorum SN15]EAT91509.1 hypothetical protein SNOG_00014 [Parastagonospora nodorum SN15]